MALALPAALAIMVSAIAAAWGFQLIGGFAPCPLCLEQRLGYYGAIPLAVMALATTPVGPLARICALVAALLIAWSAGLGVYQAGAEWGFWPGPDTCAVGAQAVTDADGLLGELSAPPPVSCTAVQGRVLGLSFAGWNAVVAGLAAALLTAAAAGPIRRPA